jgi:hypothetical protein
MMHRDSDFIYEAIASSDDLTGIPIAIEIIREGYDVVLLTRF